jgi:hypothetical protein
MNTDGRFLSPFDLWAAEGARRRRRRIETGWVPPLSQLAEHAVHIRAQPECLWTGPPEPLTVLFDAPWFWEVVDERAALAPPPREHLSMAEWFKAHDSARS